MPGTPFRLTHKKRYRMVEARATITRELGNLQLAEQNEEIQETAAPIFLFGMLRVLNKSRILN